MALTDQRDERLNDLEEAHDSNTGAPHLQPESRNDANSTAQRTNLQDLLPKSDSARRLDVEKVIVLSFRSLQLQRIADLQDELLILTMKPTAEKANPDQNEKIDEALENYGKPSEVN